MKLEPIEEPRGLVTRIGYWMARRRFGKVPSAFKVIYARAPKLAQVSYQVSRVLDKGLSLDSELVQLLMTHASMINGCSFCADLHQAELVRARIGLEKFEALLDFRGSQVFTPAERAALEYAEAVTRREPVDDALFAQLRQHYDERQQVELCWVVAVGNYFNLMAVPLGLESDGLAELALGRRAA